MPDRIRHYLLIACWALFAPPAYAEQPPMVFDQLALQHGLSQSTVMDIHQDSQGFVWLATENGLNRYDGYTVSTYMRESGNAEALGSDYIWAIEEDSDGNLWLATEGGGVAVWDRSTDSFRSFRHDPDDPDSLSSNSIRNILTDSDGRIWVATSFDGLNLLDPETGKVERFQHDPDDPESISSNALFALLEDRNGDIWVGTEKGLNVIRPDTQTFRRFTHEPENPNSLNHDRVFALTQDSRGDIWIATFQGGVNRLDPITGRFSAYLYDAEDSVSLSHNDVRAIFEDDESRLWVGTANGLNLFDRASNTFQRYQTDRTNPRSLSDDYIMTIYQDRGGMLWLGTRLGGANRWNPRSWSFGHYYRDWLENAFVTSFADDPGGRIWLGTVGAGLSRLNLETGERIPLAGLVNANSNALPDERIMSLLIDRNEQLWIGTMTGGLSRVLPDGNLQTFRFGADDTESISADGIMTLYEDEAGRIWAGTFGGGVSVFDQESGKFRRYPAAGNQDNPLDGARATAIVESNNGGLWIGTDGAGLVFLDPYLGNAQQFLHDAQTESSLAADTVYALHKDSSDRIWIGTAGGGLDLLVGDSSDPDSIEFVNYSQSSGLSSNVIYGIHSDDSGFLWLSSNNGLMRFDPKTGQVKTFHTSHGLQGEEFTSGAHHRMRDGRLLFAGANGINAFDPTLLEESRIAPPIVLTGFEVLNEPAAVDTPVPLVKSIELGYEDDVVSFEFAALDFTDPAQNRYAYQLVGFDDTWIETGTRRRATYTNLDAGDYVFRVKGVSAESVWNTNGLSIPVTVKAAPWQSPTAYTAYVMAILLSLYALFRRQALRLKHEAQYAARLACEVADRTIELNKRNQELKEASEEKSSFLARMSHEIRTPMNGVIGLTELLRSTALSRKQAQYTQTISRSAQTLLRIINDILDLSKIEAGHLSLEAVEFDLAEVVDDTVDLIGAEASGKGIELISSIDPRADFRVIGDPLRLRQVLTNLVSNAVKFTEDGEVTISARIETVSESDALIHLDVNDTGIGMDAETLSRVFEAFSQADESTTRQFGGTGLGLSICEQLIALMGGELSVNSTPGVGTSFACRIPVQCTTDVAAAGETSDLSRLRAIVATQNRSLREAILQYLAGIDVHAVSTESATELTEAAERYANELDLIIVDVDGFDALALRQASDSVSARTARIFLSRQQAGPELSDSERRDSDETLHKPVRWPILSETIGRVTGRTTESSIAVDRDSRERLQFSGRVLLVEDNSVNQMVGEGMLRKLGCQVSVAIDGRAAVARMTTEDFDVVLMDSQMPGMDGLEATRLIREWESNRSRTPIVGVTAHASDESRAACVAAGMDDYLSKPFTLAELTTTLGRWLPSETVPPTDVEILVSPDPMLEIDDDALQNIRFLQTPGRPDLVTQVIDVFLDSSSRIMEEIADATLAGSLERLQTAAHTLKSSSANIGATEFASLAQQLESACQTNDKAAAVHIADTMKRIYPRVICAFQDRREAMSA